MGTFSAQSGTHGFNSLRPYPAIYISLAFSFLSLLKYSDSSSTNEDRCLVSAPAGTYRGLIGTSILYPESVHCKFLGIKYAEALGDRRFGKPIAVQSRSLEVYDALSYGSICPQNSQLANGSTEPLDEDCLFLNVFTPKTYQTANENSLRAVIVYIHGGGFSSGRSDVFSPDYLVPRDVLLVVMNYRLGAFGFLNLNITGCPGNMGLWDQSMALKWIRRNIKAFGGDPKRITLTGQSAGAMSVYLHILSPESQDLFQRAIIQSPTTTYKLVRDDIVSKSIAYARFVGCPNDSNDRKKILRCLQQKSSADLLKGFAEFQTMLLQTDDAYHDYGLAFWPSEDVLQEHPFLPSTSLEELGKKTPNIDVIMGQLSADAAAYFNMYNNSEVIADLQRNVDLYLRKEPIFVRDKHILQIVIAKIKGYYFNGRYEDNILDETQKLLLDLTYSNWYTETIPFLSASYRNGKIRIYLFRVNDYQKMKKMCFGEDYRLVEGAAHMEELLYLYPESLFPNFTVTPNQLRVIREMTMYWSNFAKYGDPNSDTSVRWKPILPHPAQPNFLDFGHKSTIFVEGKRIEEERREFWDELQIFAEQYYNYLSNMKLNFGENGLY